MIPHGNILLEFLEVIKGQLTHGFSTPKNIIKSVTTINSMGKNIAEVLELTFAEAYEFFNFDFVLKEN